jgi:pimeloyl-ACP methyl ester carboxylesterase
MTARSFSFSHRSADLFVTEAGAGDAVVFLHAGVTDQRMWQEQMVAFAPTHHVIAYDRRGFGQTRCRGSETVSPVEDLLALLDHMGIARATLIGCSLGGRLAIDTALDHPDRVTAIGLIATSVSGAPQPETYPADIQALADQQKAAEAAHDLDAVNALQAHLWLDGPQAPEGRVSGAARTLFFDMNGLALRHPPVAEPNGPSAYERLSQIRCPTLVISGLLDFPHIVTRSAHLAETIPGARLIELPNMAHLPSLEAPKMVNEALRNLIGFPQNA